MMDKVKKTCDSERYTPIIRMLQNLIEEVMLPLCDLLEGQLYFRHQCRSTGDGSKFCGCSAANMAPIHRTCSSFDVPATVHPKYGFSFVLLDKVTLIR
jgi:hypothetical protein